MLVFLKNHKFIISLLLVTGSLALSNQTFVEFLYYSHVDLRQGEWWRFWTGHLSHATIYHWLINMGAVLVLYYFFKPYFDSWHWLLTLTIIMPFSSYLFLMFDLDFDYYTGFSGVVQGWLSFLLVRSIRESVGINLAILTAQWGRIIYEHMPGYNINYMQDLIGGAVAIDAHLYGAALGVLCGCVCLYLDRKARRFEVGEQHMATNT